MFSRKSGPVRPISHEELHSLAVAVPHAKLAKALEQLVPTEPRA